MTDKDQYQLTQVQIEALVKRNRELESQNYLNSLKDETTFRAILLQEIQAVRLGIDKLVEISSNEGSNTEQDSEDEEDEELDDEPKQKGKPKVR